MIQFSLVLFLLLSICVHYCRVQASSSEASSTLLRMHRLYLQQPPHDTTLYDVLHVSPNATMAEITKSYRRLCRKYHPDKQQQKQPQQTDDALERVREAYEVLKQDGSRLPYHRYGLVDMVQAVFLLTGRSSSSSSAIDPALWELLQLMGYPMYDTATTSFPSGQAFAASSSHSSTKQQQHVERVRFLATHLAGTIRPVVEGAVSEAFLADIVASMCDRLKILPMGAQILRCIGRAYRYSGRRLLRRYHANPQQYLVSSDSNMVHNNRRRVVPSLLDVRAHVRDQCRHTKHIFNAAVASGRVLLSEQQQKARRTGKNKKYKPISYHWEGNMGDPDYLVSDDDRTDAPPTDQDIREEVRRKAQGAVLESLQVEALWKVTKIELDRTIREACDCILEGEDNFFSSPMDDNDGWVGSSGIAIPTRVGRVRAAAALVMVGDIMVQRSKEGTAWME
jgi:hypothetical protein